MSFERRGIKSIPQKWSDSEEALLLDFLLDENKTLKDIIDSFPNRTRSSIRSKIRKVKIANDIFGKSYREQKKEFTFKIASNIVPRVVFDAYAGAGHQTFEWLKVADTLFASEISEGKFEMLKTNIIEQGYTPKNSIFSGWSSFVKDKKVIHIFCGDAIKAAAYLSISQIVVDILDLDTCGSTILTIPTFLNLIKPTYLVITHGEFHSYRFGREDVLRRVLCHRDINTSPLPIKNLKEELDKSVKTICFRTHNEIKDSFYPQIIDEVWLGDKSRGMLRRLYKINKAIATSDCLNDIIGETKDSF